MQVQIVEASPSQVTVQSIDYGYEGGYGARFPLDAPATADRLRLARAIL